MSRFKRDYDRVAEALAHHLLPASREGRMRLVIDAIWETLHEHGVSWAGFYLIEEESPADRRLTLGPSRDSPACSPIGMHGVCGRALQLRETVIVQDVTELGADYVACDPRDRSEIVVPLVDDGGRGWGVLDLDSFEIGAFGEDDDRGLRAILHAARLL